MSSFKQIDVFNASKLIEERQAVLVDIRDFASFSASHAKSARHLTNDSIVSFMQETEFEHPVVVMCYHGVSSQGAAQYLVNQGYEEVYSVDGGYSAWSMAGLPTQEG